MKWNEWISPLIVSVCAIALLAGASAVLEPVEAKNREKEQQKLMELLLPGGQEFSEEEYTGEDAGIRNVYRAENGCVVRTAVDGYADEITVLVGVENDGRVTGVVVEDMDETRGLGRRAMTDPEFLSQLLNTKGEAEVGVDVDSVSGATVTSRSVVRAVNSAAAFLSGVDTGSSATGGDWGAAEDAETEEEK